MPCHLNVVSKAHDEAMKKGSVMMMVMVMVMVMVMMMMMMMMMVVVVVVACEFWCRSDTRISALRHFL